MEGPNGTVPRTSVPNDTALHFDATTTRIFVEDDPNFYLLDIPALDAYFILARSPRPIQQNVSKNYLDGHHSDQSPSIFFHDPHDNGSSGISASCFPI